MENQHTRFLSSYRSTSLLTHGPHSAATMFSIAQWANEDVTGSATSSKTATDPVAPSSTKKRGPKSDINALKRRARLRADPCTENVTPGSVRCRACKKTITLDRRWEYYPGEWKIHCDRCPLQTQFLLWLAEEKEARAQARLAEQERLLAIVRARIQAHFGTPEEAQHDPSADVQGHSGGRRVTLWRAFRGNPFRGSSGY